MLRHSLAGLVSVTLSVLVGACSSPSTEGHVVESANSELTGAKSLVAQGYALVRQETFAERFRLNTVEADYPLPIDRCAGRVNEICWRVRKEDLHEPWLATARGTADRYEHPDGRIAYVVSGDAVDGVGLIVGPVRPGVYVGFDSRGRAPEVYTRRWTVRIRDLVLGEHGEFPVLTEVGIDAGPEGDYGSSDSVALREKVPTDAFGTLATGNPAPILHRSVTFEKNGDIAEYGYGYGDGRSVRSSFSMTSPSRAPLTCETPFRCIRKVMASPSAIPNASYELFPSKEACDARCGDGWNGFIECAPADVACL